MIILFEVHPPCRIKPRIENFVAMKRIIWLWFSIAVFPKGGINELFDAFEKEGYQRRVKEEGDLYGDN